MTEKQVLQPISRSSPEKYSEGMAREEGTLKTTTRRSFLTGAASAVAATSHGAACSSFGSVWIHDVSRDRSTSLRYLPRAHQSVQFACGLHTPQTQQGSLLQ